MLGSIENETTEGATSLTEPTAFDMAVQTISVTANARCPELHDKASQTYVEFV